MKVLNTVTGDVFETDDCNDPLQAAMEYYEGLCVSQDFEAVEVYSNDDVLLGAFAASVRLEVSKIMDDGAVLAGG